jgi:hypothetical protein
LDVAGEFLVFRNFSGIKKHYHKYVMLNYLFVNATTVNYLIRASGQGNFTLICGGQSKFRNPEPCRSETISRAEYEHARMENYFVH